MVQFLHNLYATESMNKNELYNDRLSALFKPMIFLKLPYCLYAWAALGSGMPWTFKQKGEVGFML